MKTERRLISTILLLVSVLGGGGAGYRLIEGWPWTDSLYMAIITVTTVGFSEVHPLSYNGRIFTSILILTGVGSIAYAFGVLTDYIIAGELRGFLEERRMNREIGSLSQHFIVCGYGRMGQEVARELKREGHSVVVVDDNAEAATQAQKDQFPVIEGDPGRDATLSRAGIRKAAGLVASSDDDAGNLMVVLSASALNPGLSITARVSGEDSSEKFQRAGARTVFCPYQTGGRRMAQMMVKPELVGFLDVLLHDESLNLLLENLTVGDDSELSGKTLERAKVRQRTGCSVVGLKRPTDGFLPDMDLNTVIQAGDTIIAIGNREQLRRLHELAGGK